MDGKTTMGNKITVTAAAALLGVTPQRVRHMIQSGILQAEKFGRDWQIDGESVEIRRKTMEQKKREP
jgi:excisionase family DNA binding protein